MLGIFDIYSKLNTRKIKFKISNLFPNLIQHTDKDSEIKDLVLIKHAR